MSTSNEKVSKSEEKLAERIYNFRTKRNISQDMLAEAIGKSRNYISMIENGREPGANFLNDYLAWEAAILKSEQYSDSEKLASPRLIEDAGFYDSGQSLLELMAASMLTKEEFADGLKVTVPELEQMLHGLKPVNPNQRFRAGQLASNPKHTLPKISPRISVRPQPIKMERRRLMRIGMAAAGAVTDFEDIMDWEDYIDVEIDDPKAFAIRIVGDSMEPRYPDGCTAIVAPSDKPQSGNLVVARLRDEGVIFKKLQVVNAAQKLLRLISFNPDYIPIERNAEELIWLYRVRQVIIDV